MPEDETFLPRFPRIGDCGDLVYTLDRFQHREKGLESALGTGSAHPRFSPPLHPAPLLPAQGRGGKETESLLLLLLLDWV